MADFIPVKIGSSNELSRFQTGDTVGLLNGGTGSTTASGARTSLGLAIGADVQAYAAKLGTLTALASQGIVIQDGAGGWFVRSLATASSSRITVSNADGTAGNPTVDLATLSDSGTGTFLKVTRDTYGRISGTTAVVTADITALVDATYINVSGDTMAGFLTLNADPSSALHAATKQYVDTAVAAGGIAPFAPVVVRTTASITLTGTQTIDGIAIVATNRVLVMNQATGSQNGIYVAAVGAWTRATDADASTKLSPGRQVFIQSGTLYGMTGWGVSNITDPIIGTDAITFVQTGGAIQYTGSTSILLTGTQFTAIVAARLSLTGSGIDMASGVVTPGTYTKITVDTYGRATVGATATPSDIGAQPVAAQLTSLSSYNTNGLIVQTAANTYVGRTLVTGSSSRITVTSGDGVAGNPSIDLATTGIGAGTYNSLTVDIYGRATGGTTAASTSLTSTATNGNAGAVVICRAVYSSGADTVDVANANSYSTSNVIGLSTSTTTASAGTMSIATSGVVSATTAQWDTVTSQSGGLTSGSVYYLSNTTAGAITTTAPASGVLAPIGIALSTTRMKIAIQRVVIL